jgi:hypothetical protein
MTADCKKTRADAIAAEATAIFHKYRIDELAVLAILLASCYNLPRESASSGGLGGSLLVPCGERFLINCSL